MGKLKIDTIVHCAAELGVVRLKSGFLWGLQQLQHVRATFHVLEPPSTRNHCGKNQLGLNESFVSILRHVQKNL